MITLREINEANLFEAAKLNVAESQKHFVAPSPMILARAYAYRCQRAVCFGIYADEMMVGLSMIHDMEEEPACYHLCEFMIDASAQGKGYGQAALAQILDFCRQEGKYPRVEVCVKMTNTAAIHIYEKLGFRWTGYHDPENSDSVCMVCDISAPEIRVTGKKDLKNVQRLWATPEVMHYVGFPDGLKETLDALENQWLPWVQAPPCRQHYSVYDKALGYCGEAFYDVDETGLACMDIKLLPIARGKGIGFKALAYALNQAFEVGNANCAYVDPNPDNLKALKLYERLGFRKEKRAAHLEDPGCPYVYMELSRKDWEVAAWR